LSGNPLSKNLRSISRLFAARVFFAQGQHAKRDELVVEIFALTRNHVERVVLKNIASAEDRTSRRHLTPLNPRD
jgi:hypothetical protein